jgi:hypothetical protein
MVKIKELPRCGICCGNLKIIPESDLVVCNHCGVVYHLPTLVDIEKRLELYSK